MAKDKNDQSAKADIDATVRQLEQQLKKVWGSEIETSQRIHQSVIGSERRQ
jgi:hypothetical protein